MSANIASAIATAISRGFNSRHIINYLISKFPQHANQINQALAMGYTADRVLKHLVKGGRSSNPENTDDFLTESEKTDKIDRHRKRKQAMGLGAAALGTVAGLGALGSLAARGTGAIMSSAILPPLPGGPPQLPSPAQQLQLPNTQQISPAPQPVPNPSPAPQPVPNPSPIQPAQPSTQTINPNPMPQAPIAPTQPMISSSQILQNMGHLQRATNLLKAGNSPETVATTINYIMKGDERKAFGQMLKSGQVKPLIEMIKDVQIETQQAQPGPVQPTVPEQPETEPENPIAKKSIVATPDGIGEVKSDVRNGKAIVEVNGKNFKVDEKSLLKPPKEAAVEALELIKGFTPEEMRSTHHMLNAYDEGEQKGFFVFHNGSAYVVDDISPEEYKELSEEVEKAKTTGETIIGKWASGEGSRGAGYNKVVKGVRDRKVVPELKKKFRKLKVGYNLLAEWQRLLNEK